MRQIYLLQRKGKIMNILNIKSLVAVGALLFAGSVSALEVGGSVGVSSEYIFRGMAQNANSPAVSADVNVSAGNFYAGVWGSQVDYGTDIEAEYDIYAGYKMGGEGLTLDVAYIDYNYSSFDELVDFNESALDVEEVMVSLGYKAVSASYFKGMDDAADYMEVSVDVLGHFDASFGDLDGAGTNWKVSKGVSIFEGTAFESDATFGYSSFKADDASDLSDEKQAFVTITKKLF